MADDLVLSLSRARRLAVRGQYLAGPEPAKGIDGMRRVLRGLRVLQMAPVNVVARSHLLVLWSRLGEFDRDDLDALLWRERWLFEYWAHAASIVLTEDYPILRAMMRAYTATVESQQKRDWLAANEEFRRYVVDLLRDSGPLPGDAIEDRSAVSWTSTGWTNGRNVERMLDILWKQGVVTVVGDRTERLWGFTYRNEMYVPKHKRKFGCYVMPVLAGERLIGRVVPRVDRRRGELVVEGVFAEEEFSGAGAMADRSVAAAIELLASFAGAASVSYSSPVSFGVS